MANMTIHPYVTSNAHRTRRHYRIKREYAEANELLKALNIEPIEVPDHYTEGYQQRWIEAAELRRHMPLRASSLYLYDFG